MHSPNGCMLLRIVLQEKSVLRLLFWVPAQRTDGGTGLGGTWMRSLSAPALSALSAGSKGWVPVEEQSVSWPCMSLLLSVSRLGLVQGNLLLGSALRNAVSGSVPSVPLHRVRRCSPFALKPFFSQVE